MRNASKSIKININGQEYSERHLSQIIRRKMMSKVYKDKTKYTRKSKHKSKYGKYEF